MNAEPDPPLVRWLARPGGAFFTRHFRSLAIGFAAVGTAGIGGCLLRYPAHSAKLWPRFEPLVLAGFVYAVLGLASLFPVRIASDGGRARKIAFFLLLQLAVYAGLWAGLAVEDLVYPRTPFGGTNWARHVDRWAWSLALPAQVALGAGPFLVPGILQSMRRAWGLAAVEVLGVALLVAAHA